MPKDLPELGVDGRILEGIVTTYNPDGMVNIAPMGPIVDSDFTALVFRPFKTSATYRNLVSTRAGVLHVTDDVELFAQAAIGRAIGAAFHSDMPLVLSGACRAYRFEVVSVADVAERATLVARVRERYAVREFFGFNRAQHAVIEAAILATRLHLVSGLQVAAEFARLETIVDKTGAAPEHRAFQLLKTYVAKREVCGESVKP